MNMHDPIRLRSPLRSRAPLRAPLLRVSRIAVCAVAGLLVAACGAPFDGGHVRVINASSSGDAVSVLIDDELRYDTIAGLGSSDYQDIDSGTRTVTLTRPSDSQTLATASMAVATDTNATIIAWSNASGSKLSVLSDDNASASSGHALVRVFNASADAGTIDVYVTAADADISGVPATVSATSAGSASGFATTSSGALRLRVTGSGQFDDIRLDTSSLVLADRAAVTLVVASGSGGYLVHALSAPDRSAITELRNTAARVRAVAAVSDNAVVAATVGDHSLLAAARSPGIGNYALIETGSAALTATINGATIASEPLTLVGGADYSVIVRGTPDAGAATLFGDDNRLPSTGRTKFRLLNALAGEAGTVSAVLDYTVVAGNVAYPGASSYALISPTGGSRLEVTSTTLPGSLYLNTDTTLSADAVYTLYLVGGAAAPTGVLRKDR